MHVSEQPAENEACQSAYGCSPTELLSEHGVLGSATTAVHATHVSEHDIALLGESETAVCVCPTTERDLGDGLGPARALADAGAPLTLGTDQHVMVDMLAEGRGLEMHERLRSGQRGPVQRARARRGDVTERARGARAGPRRVTSRSARCATSSRSGSTRCAPRVRCPSRRCSSRPPATSTPWWSRGGSSSQGGRHVLLEADGGPGVPERLIHAVSRAWDEH